MAADAARDPRRDFAVRDAGYIDGDRAFLATVNAELAKRPPGHRKIFLFVHGFNTMFAEALYGFTQVVHDAHTDHVPVLFTWASRGKLTDYLYDNNSATAARDQLAHTIRLLTDSNAEEVNILAHSMGNWGVCRSDASNQNARRSETSGEDRAGPSCGAGLRYRRFKSDLRAYGKLKKPITSCSRRMIRLWPCQSFWRADRPRVGRRWKRPRFGETWRCGYRFDERARRRSDGITTNTHRSPRSPRNWSTCFKAASKRTMSRRLTQRIR